MVILFHVSPGSATESYEMVLKCALARSGCRVVSIAERRFGKEEWINYKELAEEAHKEHPELWDIYVKGHDWNPPGEEVLMLSNQMAFSRWFMFDVLMRRIKDRPVMVPDWDVLIASDMNKVMAPFSDICFVTTAMNPILFNVPGVLNDMLFFLNTSAKQGTLFPCDMKAWDAYCKSPGDRTCAFRRASIESGVYLDPNVHLDCHTFMENRSIARVSDPKHPKLIVWKDRDPFFVLRDSNTLYPAHIIHCWGSYKTRIVETARRMIE